MLYLLDSLKRNIKIYTISVKGLDSINYIYLV